MTPTPSMLVEDSIATIERPMWVFGYGSLVWKTGFEYTTKKIGYIRGYHRRFWQGDDTHRGTNSAPGRVATLEKNESGHVWGVAFELVGRKQIEAALEHLGMRECTVGGYDMQMVPFYSRDHATETTPALLFVATTDNKNYIGKASIEDIANQVVSSKGKAGYNVEYVTRLADFMRDNIPESNDKHLFDLDRHVRRILKETNVAVESLLSHYTNYSYMYEVKPTASLSNNSRPINKPVKGSHSVSHNVANSFKMQEKRSFHRIQPIYMEEKGEMPVRLICDRISNDSLDGFKKSEGRILPRA